MDKIWMFVQESLPLTLMAKEIKKSVRRTETRELRLRDVDPKTKKYVEAYRATKEIDTGEKMSFKDALEEMIKFAYQRRVIHLDFRPLEDIV